MYGSTKGIRRHPCPQPTPGIKPEPRRCARGAVRRTSPPRGAPRGWGSEVGEG